MSMLGPVAGGAARAAGKAGSGKSLLAANVALDLLFSREIEKIIITRPTVVAGQDIGFLPGDVNEELTEYLIRGTTDEQVVRLSREAFLKCVCELLERSY